jgi:hypothetical protein
VGKPSICLYASNFPHQQQQISLPQHHKIQTNQTSTTFYTNPLNLTQHPPKTPPLKTPIKLPNNTTPNPQKHPQLNFTALRPFKIINYKKHNNNTPNNLNSTQNHKKHDN